VKKLAKKKTRQRTQVVSRPTLPPKQKVAKQKVAKEKVSASRRADRALIKQATELRIHKEADEVVAVDMVRRLKALIAHIEEDYSPLIRKQREALDALRQACRSKIEPLEEAVDTINKRITEYEERVEREKREAAAKIDEERRKQEQAQRRALAADLMLEGKEEEAKKLLAAPSDVQETVLEQPHIEGMGRRETLTWELVDITKMNAAYLLPNRGAIQAALREHREAAAEIVGGIKVVRKPSNVFTAASIEEE
jgi:hypothetical protein